MNSEEILALLEKPTRHRTFFSQIRDEAAVVDIVAALRVSTNPSIRCQLCYILNLRAGAESFEGRYSETKQAIPALLEVLADPDTDVHKEALDALGHIGDPTAGPPLLALYHKEEKLGRRIWLAAIMAACHFHPVTPILIEALSSSNDEARRQATWGLGLLQAQEAKEPLRQALIQETIPLTRQAMQETLQELEHPSTGEEKIARLIAQLKSAATVDERQAVATVLGDMDERVLAPLLTLLHSEQSEVRQYAAVAISGLSEHRDADWFVRLHREQVQEALIQALADQDSGVRAAAAQALGQWGDTRAVKPLLAAIQDADVEVRRAVVATLTYPKDERALEPLLNAFLTDDDLQVQAYAAEGLGRHQEDNRAVNILIRGLQDQQVNIRKKAAELLSWLKDERATVALTQALHDTNHEVREWSIEALWQLCTRDDLSKDAIEKMRNPVVQASRDGNREVKECAEKILEWLD